MSDKFKGPLFIVGLSRSGTKLIRDLINQSDFVAIPDVETHFIPKILRNKTSVKQSLKSIFKTSFVKRNPEIPFPSIENLKTIRTITTNEHLIEAILKYYGTKGNLVWDENVIWGDKTPLYLRSLDLLKKHFPESKIIHIIRDPRDRAISVKKTWGKSMNRAIQKWQEELYQAQKWRGNKTFYYEIMYEDLLQRTEGVIQEFCDFLDIPFQQEMLQLSKPAEKHGKTSADLKVNSSNQQKFYDYAPKTIKRIEEIAYPMMKVYGYEPIYAKRHKPINMKTVPIIKLFDYMRFRISNKIKGY